MTRIFTTIALLVTFNTALSDEISDMIERGKEIYFQPGSCVICHADNAKGLVGPDITYGPSPFQIWDQLDSNPQMKPLYESLDPTDDDLLAISTYLISLSGRNLKDTHMVMLRETLGARPKQYAGKVDLNLSPRDKLVEQIKPFSTVVSDWQRKSIKGPSNRSYETTILQTWERGEEIFKPEPNNLYL